MHLSVVTSQILQNQHGKRASGSTGHCQQCYGCDRIQPLAELLCRAVIDPTLASPVAGRTTSGTALLEYRLTHGPRNIAHCSKHVCHRHLPDQIAEAGASMNELIAADFLRAMAFTRLEAAADDILAALRRAHRSSACATAGKFFSMAYHPQIVCFRITKVFCTDRVLRCLHHHRWAACPAR